MDSPFIVGIDLGTTNSALAYCESAAPSESARIEVFTIPQVVNPNEIGDRTLLPSFLYVPGDLDFPKGSLRLPWNAEPKFLRQRDHFIEDVAIGHGDVVREVVGHERVTIDPHIGSHERPLPRRPLPPCVAHLRRELQYLPFPNVHRESPI